MTKYPERRAAAYLAGYGAQEHGKPLFPVPLSLRLRRRLGWWWEGLCARFRPDRVLHVASDDGLRALCGATDATLATREQERILLQWTNREGLCRECRKITEQMLVIGLGRVRL